MHAAAAVRAQRRAEPDAAAVVEQFARARLAEHLDDHVAEAEPPADRRGEIDAGDEQVGAAHGGIDLLAEFAARVAPCLEREHGHLAATGPGVIAGETLARDRRGLRHASNGRARPRSQEDVDQLPAHTILRFFGCGFSSPVSSCQTLAFGFASVSFLFLRLFLSLAGASSPERTS